MSVAMAVSLARMAQVLEMRIGLAFRHGSQLRGLNSCWENSCTLAGRPKPREISWILSSRS